MNLVERDYLILKEIHRWRYVQGKHIKQICGFGTQSATDRRLSKLRKDGYLLYKKYLVGVAGVYSLAHKGKMLIGVNKRIEKIRIDRILHDIAVLDVACAFIACGVTESSAITTEKELHSKDGFGISPHRPDFIFESDEGTTAVEIELTLKSTDRFEKNVKDNFLNYEKQLWMISQNARKMKGLLQRWKTTYDNLEVINLEAVIGGEI